MIFTYTYNSIIIQLTFLIICSVVLHIDVHFAAKAKYDNIFLILYYFVYCNFYLTKIKMINIK